MASMCGFNLVAVPSLQSFSPFSSSSHEPRGTHPFRRQLFIPLSLPREVTRKWKGLDECLVATNLPVCVSIPVKAHLSFSCVEFDILAMTDSLTKLLSGVTNK